MTVGCNFNGTCSLVHFHSIILNHFRFIIWQTCQALRQDVTQTLSVMVAADVFLNPKHASNTKAASAGVMQYLGSKLGVTHADLAALAPKLSAQLSEAMGSGGNSDGSKKRKKEKTDGQQEAEAATAKKKAPAVRANKKRAAEP